MTTRRRFLRTTAVATGVALAGCSGDDADRASEGDADGAGGGDASGSDGTDGDDASGGSDADGGGERDGSGVAFPSLDADPPAYRRWQPGGGDLRRVFDVAYNLGRLRDRRGELPAAAYETNAAWAMFGEYPGIGYEEVDGLLLGLGAPGVVFRTDVERATIADRLAATPYERYETGDDLAYYRHEYDGRSNLVALGDEGLVHHSTNADGDADPAATFVEETTPLFEVARGDRERLHETDDPEARYAEAVGWPLMASAALAPPNQLFPFGSDPLPEAVASSAVGGIAQHLADDSLVDRYWLWTVEDGAASPEDVRSALRDDAVRDALVEGEDDRVAVRSDGRVTELAVLRPVEAPGGGTDPFLSTLSATVEDGTLTVAHLAGEPVPLDRVSARGVEADLGDGTLSVGESLTADVDPEREGSIFLFYEFPASGEQVLLDQV